MSPTSFVGVVRSRVHLKSRLFWAVGWTLFIVGGASSLAIKDGHVGLPLVVTIAAMAALLAPYLLFLFTSIHRDLSWWFRHRPSRLFLLPTYTLCVYGIYGVATGTFDWSAVGILCCYSTVPLLFLYVANKRGDPLPSLWDWAAIVSLWIPFDARWLSSIWTWPEGNGAYVLNTVLAINIAVIGFLSFRRIPNLNFRLSLSRQDVRWALLLFGLFCLISIPFGFVTGFIGWNPNISWTSLLLTPIGIFFFIAIPEELLFRGIIQSLLIRRLGSIPVGILLASLFFGLTHLNNGPAPDWRYGVLATIAGVFYGYAYKKCNGIMVPALIHGAVDSVWILLFFTGVR